MQAENSTLAFSLGTGKFNNNQLMAEAIKASETEMVTVAMKRIELEDKQDDLLAHIVQNPNIQLLPNTSGVRNAEEAVFAAQMAREAFGTNWLKLEIHPRTLATFSRTLSRLWKATEKLVKLGFVVLPYCQADPTLCKHLGRGWCCYRDATRCAYRYQQGIENERLPADHHRTGYCSCSSRCGYRCTKPCCRSNGDGCQRLPMVNTAIAVAGDPVEMGKAFKEAVICGRRAYEAGLGAISDCAEASSPLTAFLND